jgi:hypothetical protein
MGKIENIIQKLTEVPNLAKAGNYKVGDVTFSKDGSTKYTVLDVNSETGSVEWKTDNMPNVEKLFDDATDLVTTAKAVRNKAKEDKVLRTIYDESRVLRNTIRTHIRNEYPDKYRRMTMNEDLNSVSDELSNNDKRVDAVAKAIADKFDIKDDGILRGVTRVALADYMFTENTTTGGGSASFTPGSGMTYATPYAFKRPKKKQKPIPENLNEGIDLSSYGYSLVPKNKAGNYVQKGSKLDVKQLFEDQKDFQLKRVAAFDVIEQELNDIYKMLSNAKNETSEYYNDNPSSYTVIKPTDLVLDYIKDIKDLLKGE